MEASPKDQTKLCKTMVEGLEFGGGKKNIQSIVEMVVEMLYIA